MNKSINKSPKVLEFIQKHILNKSNLSDDEYENLCLAIVNNPHLSVQKTNLSAYGQKIKHAIQSI